MLLSKFHQASTNWLHERMLYVVHFADILVSGDYLYEKNVRESY